MGVGPWPADSRAAGPGAAGPDSDGDDGDDGDDDDFRDSSDDVDLKETPVGGNGIVMSTRHRR